MMNLAAATTNHPARNHFMLPSGLLIPVGFKLFVWATIIITFLSFSVEKVSGAVVITELTLSEKNAFVADSENVLNSWVQIQAGNRSASGRTTDNDTEVFINNLTAPVLKDQHDWIPGAMANSIDDSFIISHDNTVARIYATAGSGNTIDLPLTTGFNTLLITIGDASTIGSTTFSGTIAGESINWSVNNGLKYYRVDLGQDDPTFDINIGNFVAGPAPLNTDVRFRTELYSVPIPEPSVGILALLSSFLIFKRCR